VLAIEIGRPDVVLSRLPGGASLPEDTESAELRCPVSGCPGRVEVRLADVAAFLAERAELFGGVGQDNIFAWPVWTDRPPGDA